MYLYVKFVSFSNNTGVRLPTVGDGYTSTLCSCCRLLALEGDGESVLGSICYLYFQGLGTGTMLVMLQISFCSCIIIHFPSVEPFC